VSGCGSGCRLASLSLAAPWWPGPPGKAGRRGRLGGGGSQRTRWYGAARQPVVLAGVCRAAYCPDVLDPVACDVESNPNAIYGHAARQAAAAAEHIRRCAHGDPSGAADAAWAAADTLHVAARVLRSPALRCAADAYDRAARSPHGRVPHRTRDGDQLRATARLVAMMGNVSGYRALASLALIANLVALAAAVAELRQAQQHAAHAAAARAAAAQLHATVTRARSAAPRPGHRRASRRARPGAADTPRGNFPERRVPTGPAPVPQVPAGSRLVPRRGPRPPLRAGPAL